MRHVRLTRPVVGALALLGLLLPIAAPAAALPGGVVAAPIDGATEDPSSEDSRPAPPADILRDEAAGSGATAMRWLERSLLGRSLEDIARAMRARAGLPTTEAMPQRASGELRTVPTRRQPAGQRPDVRTVRVQVERGLPVNGSAFARFVMDTLNDERGWGHDGSVEFVRTDAEDPDMSVVLASPDLTDELCVPLETGGEYSCGRNERAVLNAVRWSEGARPFLDGDGNVTEYRQYLVNHEVGHLLGHPHVDCPAEGELAPIMLQQSIRLDGCEPNSWPAEAS